MALKDTKVEFPAKVMKIDDDDNITNILSSNVMINRLIFNVYI